jgi:hypothetical protein
MLWWGYGAEGTRTPDFLLAKEALSRLSYSPVSTYSIIAYFYGGRYIFLVSYA